MVEPITVILGITTLINFLSTGAEWFKKFLNRQSSEPTTLTIPMVTYPPAILPPRMIEDPAKIEYENFKQKKESVQSFQSNDHHKNSSNPGSSIGLILIITLVLAILAFIIYRKRTKFNENRFTFRQTEKYIGSPPSPPTSQTERNQSSIWSAIADPTQQQNLTII